MFVSIGAVSISATYNSASSTTGNPSDNPVRTVLHLPPFTSPPTPVPTTPAPTPPSTAGTANGTPQMTPTRSTPRPSSSSPSASPGGNSSQSNPSGVVDLSGDDDDGKSSSSSGASASSSSAAPGRGASAIQDAAKPSIDIVGVSNMVEYPDMGCSLPNYISKNGKLFAVGPAGETHQLVIKGVNWFGMESDARVPLGLGASEHEGSTLFEIGAFLARNNFNSVRLPLSVASVLSNAAPGATRVNQAESRALNLASYMTTLQSIVKGLAYHHISVLIALDAHRDTGGDAPEEQQLSAVDALASGLCNKAYWNVLGVDLRSNPVASTWGDGSEADFRAAATRMGNRMLEGCSKWLAFVEGNSESHEWTSPSTGKQYRFEDWWGGGLAKAKAFPIALALPDKVVYAPHYHSPAAYPASYFYQDDGVSELGDKELEENVRGTFDAMFGFLAKDPSSPALVLGEFGALYATDRHPQKTTRRAFEYTVKLVSETSGVAGGYVWSLNPERGFEFNYGKALEGASGFREGLVRSDWRAGNMPLLKALAPLDAMPGLAPLQCIKKSFRLRRR
ncbi:hypothetical protein PybrP1_003143 [[Pythium] brassicae (nom. inval.)]|nr:hypothetical protein PybrP1_003143 [[Pythium] brassicae (nom. inval.)]